MPDNTQDSAQDTTESQAIPKPTILEDSEGQPSSEVSADAIAKQVLESLAPQLDDLVSKKVQSTKDKRLDRVEKISGGLSQLEQALADVAAGGDPQAILAAAQQQDLAQRLAKLESSVSSPSSAGNSESGTAFDKAVGLLTEAGLAGDPEVTKLMSGSFKTDADMLFAASELVLRRQIKPRAPAEAATPPASAGTVMSGKVDVDALTAELETLRLKGNWDEKLNDTQTVKQRMDEIYDALATAV